MTRSSPDYSTADTGDTYSQWECLVVAVRFLTRVPLPGGRNRSQAQYAKVLQRSVAYFPLVGGLVGVFTASALLVGVMIGVSPILAALIAIGLEALITGALHEDAFADTCDALGGGWTRDRVLEIMKCSQLGTYGVMALVIGVGARAAAMAAISAHGTVWTLASIVAAACIGRAAMVGIMATTQPIAEGSSLTKEIAGSQDWRGLAWALCISAPFWLGWLALDTTRAGASLVVAIAVLFWFRSKVLKVLSGTTGDVLGCSAFFTQLILLIGASAK